MPVQAPPPGIFSGLGTSTKLRKNAIYCGKGRYWARLDVCKIIQDRNNIHAAVIEMTTVHVVDDVLGQGHRLGDEVCRFIKAGDFFKPEVKQFMCGVLGLNPDTVSDEDAEKAATMVFGPAQPLAGKVVEWLGREITKKNGEPFTKIEFRREVPASELEKTLPADEISRFFGNGIFAKMKEVEKAGGTIAPPPAAAGSPPPPPPPASTIPANAPRSADGFYWWDQTAKNGVGDWRLIPR